MKKTIIPAIAAAAALVLFPAVMFLCGRLLPDGGTECTEYTGPFTDTVPRVSYAEKAFREIFGYSEYVPDEGYEAYPGSYVFSLCEGYIGFGGAFTPGTVSHDGNFTTVSDSVYMLDSGDTYHIDATFTNDSLMTFDARPAQGKEMPADRINIVYNRTLHEIEFIAAIQEATADNELAAFLGTAVFGVSGYGFENGEMLYLTSDLSDFIARSEVSAGYSEGSLYFAFNSPDGRVLSVRYDTVAGRFLGINATGFCEIFT